MKMNKKLILAPVLAVSLLASLTGCRKPYDTPEFVEIKPNQTAFVIPLEGKTSDQGKFDSEEFLKKSQVASKRIQVPHKWVQTGRRSWNGKWVATVRVVIVDRFPESREWFNDAARSSSGKSQGFIGESKDSIKFKIGLSATAQILEGDDTARFLYQYSGKKLQEVMDSEVRTRIGTVLLEKYGSLSIEQIRSSKAEVIQYVREQVEPYFKDRGITISNIGYVGDLEYLQADIQEAINKQFKAEQNQKAQTVINQTEVDKATAEKQANSIRKESMKEIMEMKQLDIQQQWIEKWNGSLPQVQGSNGNMIQIPELKK